MCFHDGTIGTLRLSEAEGPGGERNPSVAFSILLGTTLLYPTSDTPAPARPPSSEAGVPGPRFQALITPAGSFCCLSRETEEFSSCLFSYLLSNLYSCKYLHGVFSVQGPGMGCFLSEPCPAPLQLVAVSDSNLAGRGQGGKGDCREQAGAGGRERRALGRRL